MTLSPWMTPSWKTVTQKKTAISSAPKICYLWLKKIQPMNSPLSPPGLNLLSPAQARHRPQNPAILIVLPIHQIMPQSQMHQRLTQLDACDLQSYLGFQLVWL
uniref:Uncharacterized protein n=1 Tax=Arundo donax TaxID=35708 RepID=A0A0A9CGX1_ARUDO